jgi:uncharacterized protein YdaU (DUF1376 family)
MANFPAMPLFTDAYLGDTRHLTTLQHGAYLLMLMVAWRSTDCALPNDDVYLSRITGMDRRTWNANKETLLAFWRLNDEQKWVQARLKDEYNYVEQKRNNNSASGNASALKRKNRASTNVQRIVNGNSTPTPTPIEVSKESNIPLNNSATTSASDFQRVFDEGAALLPLLTAKDTAPIRMWLTAGADVDMDILPTLRRLAACNPKTWSYFTQAVMDSKATREKPPPAGRVKYQGQNRVKETSRYVNTL